MVLQDRLAVSTMASGATFKYWRENELLWRCWCITLIGSSHWCFLANSFSTGSTFSFSLTETRSCLSPLANTFTNFCGPVMAMAPLRWGRYPLDTCPLDTACLIDTASGRTTPGSLWKDSLDDMAKSFWEDTEWPAIFHIAYLVLSHNCCAVATFSLIRFLLVFNLFRLHVFDFGIVGLNYPSML
jgi:hypothetical protein